MIRSAILAAATILAAFTADAAAGPQAVSVEKASLTAAGRWVVVYAGEPRVTHCMIGIRSDAASPEPGRPQFVISADEQFVMLRVRAAEWSFTASRDIAVTLVTSQGVERKPAASVHGTDLIDNALGVEADRMNELADASHLEIHAEGTTVSLPIRGLAAVLPAYRACLGSIGQPVKAQVHASIH
jgi:hypothetical protein